MNTGTALQEVKTILVDEISKKNSWGKNELKELITEQFFTFSSKLLNEVQNTQR